MIKTGPFGATLPYDPRWLAKQRSEKDWRPEGYYELLRERFGGMKENENIPDEERTMVVLVKAYRALEIGCYYGVGDTISEPVEILEIGDEYATAVPKGGVCILLDFFQQKGLPDGDYDTSSHKSLCRSIIENTSFHWVREMEIMLVRDSAGTGPIPWDFSK